MEKKEQKAIVIGKASFLNFDEFVAWCESEEADSFFTVDNLWRGVLYNLQGEIPGVNVSNLFDKTKSNDYYCYGSDNRKRNYIEPLTKYVNYIKTFSSDSTPLSFNLLYEHEKFDIITFGSTEFLIPAGYLAKSHLKDYSKIPISALHAALNGEMDERDDLSIIPTNSTLEHASVSSQMASIDAQQKELARVAADIDDVENARVGELAELQAEIDRKMAELQAQKDKMMEVLLAKKAEMELVKEKLEQELFILESEIYSIRCFTGEVIDFVKLRSGNATAVDHPITLFQKLRFLDEELAKIASIYNFDFADYELFETLLKKREDVVETFCPNEKSVTLIRVSRTNKAYGYASLPYGPVLAEYEVYHGEKIGILIRNGENLYLGWTDDEKINIPENMFYMPGETVVTDEDGNGNTDSSTPIKEAASRYFVFSILQGALANKKLFTLPEGVKAKFSEPSEYIIYSSADDWLVDNRYGTFDAMIDRVNEKISVGDDILALEYLSDGNYRNNGGWGGRFEYNRDRNFSHRTHDTYFHNGSIYKINLIEDEDDYYVSLPKSNMDYIYRGGRYYKRQREARANFRVYSDEFINLTYMNSVWLKYVITTRNLGGRGRMSHFAEVARYLNKALEFVKEREKEECSLIEKYLPALSEDSEWPAKLSEWKLEKGVRKITDFQAKRFVKYYIAEQSL